MALVTALMAMLMLLALGAGVAMTTMTESTIAANHRDGIQALYAAEAGVDLAFSRLRATEDWHTLVKAGDATPFVQGRLADLLQNGTVDPRIDIVVTVSPDADGHEDVLVLQSSAIVRGGIRRTVEVVVQKQPATGEIDRVWWR